jgi:hypothetical protein
LVATIDDLTDMLDYNSENAEYMDEEDVTVANAEVGPPVTGRWSATSTYDIYMVDTPKDGNGTPEQDRGKPRDEPPKRQKQRRR